MLFSSISLTYDCVIETTLVVLDLERDRDRALRPKD